MLDRLLKISSLSSAVLIFCGILKLIIYYSAFDIRIVEFLSFSEIIMSFLDDINILIIFILAMVIQSVPVFNFLHKKSGLSQEDFSEGVLMFFYKVRKVCAVFFLAVLVILGALLFLSSISLDYFVIYILIVSLIQFLTYLSLEQCVKGRVEISHANMVLTLMLVTGVSIFLLARHDIERTRSYDRVVSIQLANQTIECNSASHNLYLGKTDHFLFVRTAGQSTVCLPVSEVNSIVFREK